METAAKAAALGIIPALMALLLRKSNAELALCLTLAACCAISISALALFSDILSLLRRSAELSGLSDAVLSPVLKCVGIGVIAKLAGDLCRDSGSAALASSVELACALAALAAALPLLSSLLGLVEKLL